MRRNIVGRLLVLVAALLILAPAGLAQTESSQSGKTDVKAQDVKTQRQVRRTVRRARTADRNRKLRISRSGRGLRMRGISRLNLTEGQRQQIDQLQRDFDERTKDLRSQIRTKRNELGEIRRAEQFNEPLALQKLTEIAQLEARLMGEESRHSQALKAVIGKQ